MLPERLDAAQRARIQALLDGVDWKECMPQGWEEDVLHALAPRPIKTKKAKRSLVPA